LFPTDALFRGFPFLKNGKAAFALVNSPSSPLSLFCFSSLSPLLGVVFLLVHALSPSYMALFVFYLIFSPPLLPCQD